jgi:cytosine/adenosine deaminase-related metal-dependent hydrolase
MENIDILIDSPAILRICESPMEDVPKDAEIIDCSHHAVIPGLVNTHHHFYQTLTRNLPGAQSAKLFDWLLYLYPFGQIE